MRPADQRRGVVSGAIIAPMNVRWWIAPLVCGLLGCQLAEPGAEDGSEEESSVYFPIPVPRIFDRDPKPSHVIYLNREGALLQAGADEASENRSSIVANAELEEHAIPEFRGSARSWDRMVSCLRGQFEAYDVAIVEERPTRPGYMMAVFGGRPGPLGGHQHGAGVTGLAPFSGEPIENAVVLVFTRQLRERAQQTCETAAMEIAHAFGLDHTRHCRDLMSYRRPCGRRRFMDEAAACGEHEDRSCGDGNAAQNSHALLLDVLGPTRTGEPDD